MRTTILKTALTLVLLLLAGAALADGLGTSAGNDLDALWQAARDNYDLEAEDAVLLLESRHVTVSDDGALATRVHRVVWIGTSRGIREYADLRVPWNSATSTLDVEVLRTWMDGRWWPDAQRIGETAVVHTLPYAVNHADDYTSMRETMLLHDGVELPCIMETAYTIAEQGSPAAGADGLFVFPQRDPAVLTEYVVRAPTAAGMKFEELNGAPAPTEEAGSGVTRLTWQVEKSPALTTPLTNCPAAHEPAVVWTTWEDWAGLDAAWAENIAAAGTLGPDLTAALDEHLAGSIAPVADTVEFWNEAVRPIHYPFRHWLLAPRAADRTWETGYGHDLDRAVLLIAMLEHVTGAGDPLNSSYCALAEPGFGEVAADLPRLSGYDDLYVVAGAGNIMIDVDDGEMVDRLPLDVSCRLPFEDRSSLTGGARTLQLSIAPDEEGGWSGDGILVFYESAAAAMRLFGDPGAGNARVEQIVGAILPGSEIGEITSSYDAYRFTVTIAELPTNHRDQSVLALGTWRDGVLDQLPGDIHLRDETRTTPLRIPRNLVEQVELHLEVGEREYSAPEPFELVDETGRFTVKTKVEHGWLTVTRTLDISQPDDDMSLDRGEPNRYLYPASAWPGLRGLLLESQEPVHGRVVFE